MNWINYFLAFGIAYFLLIVFFIFAVVFHDSFLITRVFLIYLLLCFAFSILWGLLGLGIAIMGAINGQ